MDIPRWRIALLTGIVFLFLFANSHTNAIAPVERSAQLNVGRTDQPKQSEAIASTLTSLHIYEVQANDTIWKILQHFHIDLDQLTMHNSISTLGKIQKGMKLLIPHKQTLKNDTQQVLATDKKVIYTRSGEPIHYKKTLTCKITAYTAGPESTGKRLGDPGYGITFSGKPVTEGRTIAVDPNIIPIGSKVYIDGIGYRIAEDTGGAVKGDHIDLFLSEVNTAVNFGIQKGIPVYILD